MARTQQDPFSDKLMQQARSLGFEPEWLLNSIDNMFRAFKRERCSTTEMIAFFSLGRQVMVTAERDAGNAAFLQHVERLDEFLSELDAEERRRAAKSTA